MWQKRSIHLDRNNESNHLELFTLCWIMKINYKNSHYLWRTYGWCYLVLIRLLKLNKLIFFFHEGLSILIDFLWIAISNSFCLLLKNTIKINKSVSPIILQSSFFFHEQPYQTTSTHFLNFNFYCWEVNFIVPSN